MERSNCLKAAERLAPHLTDLRRRLHACPEIGFDLPQTTAIIQEELDRLGISFRCSGKGSIVAELGEGEDLVLLRGDMDGLPVTEETHLPFRSTNGAMHACGHDLHATMLLGAACLLKEREAQLPRRVRLLFQPAEELLEGAADAVRSGVTDGVSAAYMLHVTVGSGLSAGTVVIPPSGVTAPSADFFEICVKGKGCHGADPASGIDPLSTAAQILLALQHLPAREFPSGSRAALTVGSLMAGDCYNVIPDTARLRGTVRCYDENLREYLKERIETVSSSVAAAFRAKSHLSFPSACPSLVNDPNVRDRAKNMLPQRLGSSRVLVVDAPSGTAGSEDFAVISRTVPSLMLAVAAGDSPFPLHHPQVVFDESVLPVGAAVLAELALQ